MPGLTMDDLNNIFVYRKPTKEALPKFKSIRETGKTLAQVILINCPPCADTTAAVRKVREAVMTANQAIAVNECPAAPND